MTDGHSFAADWLRLRAPYDAATTARGPAAMLANAFGRKLRKGRERGVLKLLDLGGGNAANVARLAPRIPGSQHWTVIDSDPELLAGVGSTIEGWARAIGARFAAVGDAFTVTTPQRVVTVEALQADLRADAAAGQGGGLAALPLAEADGVTGSALLDLVSHDWLKALVATLADSDIPALFTLNVDGRLHWTPAATDDAAVAAAFGRDMRRDKGFGRALGAAAPAVAAQCFMEQGYRVETAPADWQVGTDAADAAMHRALLSFIAPAAGAWPPDGIAEDAWQRQVDAWRAEKSGLVDAAALAMTVGHGDLLAVS